MGFQIWIKWPQHHLVEYNLDLQPHIQSPVDWLADPSWVNQNCNPCTLELGLRVIHWTVLCILRRPEQS